MRLIDADALMEVPKVRKVTEYDESGEWISYLAVPVEAIKSAPTIEAEHVRHGKWGAAEIVGYDGIHPVYALPCSECGKYTKEYLKPFCPNCGAKMDLK